MTPFIFSMVPEIILTVPNTVSATKAMPATATPAFDVSMVAPFGPPRFILCLSSPIVVFYKRNKMFFFLFSFYCCINAVAAITCFVEISCKAFYGIQGRLFLFFGN